MTWVNDTATTLVPAERVYVNESGWWYEGGDFNPSETPLQDGINAAPKNGTVIVLAGTYPESVEIDNAITVETDEGVEVRGDGEEWDKGMKPVFYVDSNNVTLSGFTINSSVSNIGIWIDYASNCTVEGNTIIVTEASETVRYGVYLSYGGNNTVRNNEISVSGFQGVGIYVYEEEKGSTVNGNTVTVTGDSADGIEVFYTSSVVYDNDVSISGIGENPGYALYLYLAGDSSIYDNTLRMNASEPRAWAVNVVGEFTGSLSSNRINGILTEITCPENCMIRGVSPEERPAPPEGYGDVGEYLEASMDSWLWLVLYYEDDALTGLREDTLQVWHFSEGWTLEGTSDHQLETSKNLVGANLTQSGIFAPLAQEENDVTPPLLSFVNPTPEDGSLIGYSHVVFYITSNENLSSATLELDGINHTMTGSGKEWSYETDVPDGTHTFRAYGRDLTGNNGTGEERTFEVDTEGPVYSNVGQDRDGIPQGGTVYIHALWSDPHLMKAELYSNTTGSWEKTDEAFFEGTEGWSNFSISMDEPGLYCWYIVAIDEAGNTNETPRECFEVYSPPEIVSYSPESPVESYVGDSVTFTVTANQPVNVTWYVGESKVYSEENLLTSSYTNSSAGEGEYSVTAIIENENGTDSVSWTWYVYPKQGLTISFTEPTPEDGAKLNVRRVIVNVTSSIDLDNETLEWNGVNESMSGSGKSWWVVKENLADGTYTFLVYGWADGVVNKTEARTVEVDATLPELLDAGQSSDEVLEGEDVHVFAHWSDVHLGSAVLWSNTTFADGTFIWEQTPLEIVDGWSNWTISTDESMAGKTFCWYIVANDTFGNENETERFCFRVEERLRIVSFSPEIEEVSAQDNESVTFSVELNRAANITWFVNGSEVLSDEGLSSEYTNSSLIPGVWNVSVVARRGEEEVGHSWRLVVGTDTTPPALTFVEPTPDDGSLLGTSEVTFALESNEPLRKATLYLDGIPYTMDGEETSWSLTLSVDDGPHEFYATGEDIHGNENVTGTRHFEVDTTAPSYVIYGQSNDSVLEGEPLKVHALWSEPHPESASLETNATENGSWAVVETRDYSDWTNFTISTEGVSGTYCWRITASDSLGWENTTPTLCFEVRERLRILSFSPETTEVNYPANGTAVFSIELNQVANVTWSINGSVVVEDTGDSSTYTNSSLIPGLWNVSVTASNGNGEVSHWWLMRVEREDTTPPILAFLPPTPASGSVIASCVVTVMINASEELRDAVLELDGVNHTMWGEGSLWNYTTACLSDGRHVFRAYGGDYGNNTGTSEERVVTIDATTPKTVWVHANNMTFTGEYAGRRVFRAERKANASFEFNVSDANPAVWELYLNPEPGKINLPIWSSPYQSGIPFGFAIPTWEIGNNTYLVAITDRAGNSISLMYLVTVVDTTPPGAVENLSVHTNSSGFTARWRNPGDDDFQRVELYLDPQPKEEDGKNEKKVKELDWERAWIANVSGLSGEWMEFRWSIKPGRHVLYARTVDRYGNEGNLTGINFTVPLPQFRLEFVKPTPPNYTVLDPDVAEVMIRVKSTTSLRSCALLVNGVFTTMEVSDKNCSAKLTVIPGGNYNISVTGVDVYGRRNRTEARLFSERGTCFGEVSLTLNPLESLEDLQLVIPFTMTTRSLPKFYWYRLEAGELSASGKLQADVYSVNAKIWKDPFGRKETVYTVWGTFSVDLWRWKEYFGKYAEEGGLNTQLNIRLWDWCGNKLDASTKFTLCKNAERPKLQGQLGDFYYREEDVILRTEGSENARAFYYSASSGDWVEFNGTANLTGILRPGENTVRVKAVSPCGMEDSETFHVFIGPPRDGDWIVNDTESCLNHEFSFNGSLIVEETGNLTLRGCRVHLPGRVEVNGALGLLEGSLVDGDRLIGDGGSLGLRNSELDVAWKDEFLGGRAEIEDSRLVGEYLFDTTVLTVTESEVKGGIEASGDVSILSSNFSYGDGLLLRNPGPVEVENVSFEGCSYGIRVLDGIGSGTTFENVLIENPRESAVEINVPHSFGEVEFRNLSVLADEGIRIAGASVLIERSNISARNNAFVVSSPGKYVRLVNSSVSGDKAFFSNSLQTLELVNTNVTGGISGSIVNLMVEVEPEAGALMERGSAEGITGTVSGILTLRGYSLNGGLFDVSGTLKVEDLDGVPATNGLDSDASLLKGVRIQGWENGHLSFLNARLEDSEVIAESKWFFVRGSVSENTTFSLSSSEEALEQEITTSTPISYSGTWYYSKSAPPNWYLSASTDGMSPTATPLVAELSFRPIGWDASAEVGDFTTLYLKKTIDVDEMPLRALFTYLAVGSVELYVNGRKVLRGSEYYQPRISYTGSFAALQPHGVPDSGEVDIAAYLVPGKNVIAVRVRNPSGYEKFGAFTAKLTMESGVSGITDSVISGHIEGYGTRAIIARDVINGNLDFGYLSWVEISDSEVNGEVSVLGRLSVVDSNVTGDGSGIGINTRPQWGVVSVEGSKISGFEYGIRTSGNLTVSWSEVSGNGVGIDALSSNVLINSSYIMDNGVGIRLHNVTGSVHNNVIYGNDVGIFQVTGDDNSYIRGNRAFIDHNTFVGNGIGTRFEGTDGEGYVYFTENLLEGNSLGLYFNATSLPTVENDLLVNYRDVLVAGRSTPTLHGIDWGGEEPKMVANYNDGFMYTSSGEVQEDYDILSKTWIVVIWTDKNATEDWGSDLLSAFLRITPLENGSVKGVVTLEGSATSREGLSRVSYAVIQNETVVLLNQTVSGDSYDDYLTLDTLSMNLTGEGILQFTAVDSRGRELTSARRVYFSNAEIVIEGINVTNASNVYSLYRVEYKIVNGARMPFDWIPNKERLANFTVYLRNTGLTNGTARIEIDLPEYVERHTGKVGEPIYLGPNESGVFHVSVPIVEYDVGTLSWDVQPEELPELGRFTAIIRLYDEDNILRQEIPVTVGFTIGPVFKITAYNMYPYSRGYCESFPDSCHNSPPYDGDGDDEVEASENHHFDLYYKNVGDKEADVTMITVTDHIPERWPGTKLYKGMHAYLFPGSSAFVDTVGVLTLFGMAEVGEVRSGKYLYMDWWPDAPPAFIPPVNYSGHYMTSADFYYTADGKEYYTPSLNYKERPVKALNKTFEVLTVHMNPIDVTVMAVKDGKTYVKLHNTNGNVYYDYYVDGAYGIGEGYKWYHIIPPDFTMRAITDNSRQPNKVIPHYQIIVGARPSLVGNEFRVISRSIEAFLDFFGIDVPSDTIVMGLANAILKVVNLVETIDFQTESESFETINTSARREEVDNALLASNETVIAPVGIDTFARLEENYGMDRAYYGELMNLDQLSVGEGAKVLGKLVKAIALDEDLQVLLLESIIEVSDKSTYYELAKLAESVYTGDSEGTQGAVGSLGTAAVKKALKKRAKTLVLNEIKKTKYFKSLTKKQQKEYLKKAGGQVGAIVSYTFDMSQFLTYMALAPVPGSKTIYVLDPPANFTVKAEKADRALIFGGGKGNGTGTANVSLTFGKGDVYRARYVVLTPTTAVGPLFNGTLEWIRVNVTGSRKGADVEGTAIIEMKPTAEAAKAVFAFFRDEENAKLFAGAYFEELEGINVSIRENVITIATAGKLNALPEDEGIELSMAIDGELLKANITRRGHYNESIEIRAAFGVSLNDTVVSVDGSNASVVASGNEVLIARKERAPELNVSSTSVPVGGVVRITSTSPCLLNWRLDGRNGEGELVKTENLEPGNYTLAVECTYGNGSVEKEFRLEVTKPKKPSPADGLLVELRKGRFGLFEFSTDLYMLTFTAGKDIEGVLGVYQRPGEVEGYLTYALFNVTHPENWSLENVTLHFRVSKEWLRENNVSIENVTLLRYSGTWEEFRPIFEYADARYAYYRASVPRLSLFAVAEKMETQTPPSGNQTDEPTTPSPTETQGTSTTGTSTGSSTSGRANWLYYALFGALLVLIVAYLYRRR